MTSTTRFLALLAAAALLGAGCFTLRPVVDTMATLEPDQVVVVGRVVIDPPLMEEEQKKEGNVIDFGTLKKGVLLIGPGPYTKDAEPSMGDYNGGIDLHYGELFYRAFDKKRVVIQMLHMNLGTQRAFMPANLRLDIRADDRVVYIGTLKFKRNEFNTPLGTVQIDEWARDRAAVTKKLGASARPRLAKLSPVP